MSVKNMWSIFLLITLHIITITTGLKQDTLRMAVDYFVYKNVNYLCYLSCDKKSQIQVAREFFKHKIRISTRKIEKTIDLGQFLSQWTVPVGVVLDGSCDNSLIILQKASEQYLFDATYFWLVLRLCDGVANAYEDRCKFHNRYIDETFGRFNISVDADIVVSTDQGSHYNLTDVFNFGRIQGNNLEKNHLGIWTRGNGMYVSGNGYKYYRRWDFHNLTFRAISVVIDRPKDFDPEVIKDVTYTAGVSAMTKVAAQLLHVLKPQHNFRFNYTICDRWVGSPRKNSTLAITNALFWREQDISYTSLRIFSTWREWIDPVLPSVTTVESKFYYLMPDKGVGEYENRFLTPMSRGVWWSIVATSIVCAVVLSAAAKLETRRNPGFYAIFSVLAATCQQAYDDGVQTLDKKFSQGRQVTLFVVGLTSMLLYNYYTSSVVSWLLNAAPPTIANLEGLINSNLELIFEDIGYTRAWLDNPGVFYLNGLKNPIEDELREKKVQFAKRTVSLKQTIEEGIELVRTGAYAYHTEPYAASRVISRTFDDNELCKMGTIQMLTPAHTYVMVQKRSPYKEFFSWSMMRLNERGHVAAVNARNKRDLPECSGKTPRSLALGQAAPAFLLIIEANILSLVVLVLEILSHKLARRIAFH